MFNSKSIAIVSLSFVFSIFNFQLSSPTIQLGNQALAKDILLTKKVSQPALRFRGNTRSPIPITKVNPSKSETKKIVIPKNIVVLDTPKPAIVPTPIIENQGAKLANGAVLILRNADQNQPLRILNSTNGYPIYGAPASNSIGEDAILVAVNKPGTNIYQFFNQSNGKVLSVDTKGNVGNWLEVWNRVPNFDSYQSFYIDTLPNGNIVLCPVAFPHLVVNLPEGGRSNTYQHYTLWSKEGLEGGLNRQFKVEILGYGADVSIRQPTLVNNSTPNKNVNTNSSNNNNLNQPKLNNNQANSSSNVTIQGGLGKFLIEKLGEEILDKALHGDKILFVSLEQDRESWEEVELRCKRQAGYLMWNYTNKYNGVSISEKTCFEVAR